MRHGGTVHARQRPNYAPESLRNSSWPSAEALSALLALSQPLLTIAPEPQNPPNPFLDAAVTEPATRIAFDRRNG